MSRRRRPLIDLRDTAADAESHSDTTTSAALDPYEEESVFVPNVIATHTRAQTLSGINPVRPPPGIAAANNATASPPTATSTVVPSSSYASANSHTIAAESTAAEAASAPSSGLSGLLAYSDSDEEEEESSKPSTSVSTSLVSKVLATPTPTAVALASAALPAPVTSTLDSSLPPDWQSCVDVSSGDTYYWNQVTNETSWTRPTKMEAVESTTGAKEKSAQVDVEIHSFDADATMTDVEPTTTTTTRNIEVDVALDKHAAPAPTIAAVPIESTPAASVPVPVLSSSANALFIDALLAGLHSRLREPLSLGAPAVASIRAAISPLIRFIVQLDSIAEQWQRIQSNESASASSSTSSFAPRTSEEILKVLQQWTIDIDRILLEENEWREAQRRSQATATVSSVSAIPAFASSVPMLIVEDPTPPPPPPPAAPLQTSGYIHPSRIGTVGATTTKRPVSPSIDAKKPTANKKSKTGEVPIVNKIMGGLINKWQAANDAAIVERDRRKAEFQAIRDEARASVHQSVENNPNLIPITDDWRARVAKKRQQENPIE